MGAGARVTTSRFALAGLCLLVSAGCLANPRDDYDDFFTRADRRQPDGGSGVESRLEAISGTWLVNSLLAGGINLALRMKFQMDESPPPRTMHVQIWIARKPGDTAPYGAPILSIDSQVDADGKFVLRAEPLVLGPAELPVNTNVRASVIMESITLGKDAWCGTATGSVSEPLVLDLKGTTFSARRDDGDTLAAADVPQRCPGSQAAPDAGAGPVDAGRPMPPDLSGVPSQLADLGGQWLMSAKLAGSLPLNLWVSLTYQAARPGMPDGGGVVGAASLDGALRRATDLPGSPALASFSTSIDAMGRFEIWVPQLSIESAVSDPIRARILLSGATLGADTFCGAGVGEVTSPIQIDLVGTTFSAARWMPGTPVPMAPVTKCP
jgi:hypothetical protein